MLLCKNLQEFLALLRVTESDLQIFNKTLYDTPKSRIQDDIENAFARFQNEKKPKISLQYLMPSKKVNYGKLLATILLKHIPKSFLISILILRIMNIVSFIEDLQI